MSSVYNCVDFDVKQNNDNNQKQSVVYLCEISRTISKINSLESELCVENRFGKLFNSESYSSKTNDTFKTAKVICVSRNNCLESKQNDLIQKFDAEIEVSITTSSEKVKLTNVTHVFPKNYETISTNIFEIEAGSHIGFRADTEIVCVSSSIDEIEKLTESASLNLSDKGPLNREILNVEPILHFDSNVPNVSKKRNVYRDPTGTHCGDKKFSEQKFDNLKNVLNLNEFLKEILLSSAISSQQSLKLSRDFSANEYLDYEPKSVYATIDQQTINDQFTESKDNLSNENFTDAQEDEIFKDVQLSNYTSFQLDDNQNVDTMVTSVTMEPEIPKDKRNSSTDYETCSSSHAKRKLKKASKNKAKRKKLTRNSPISSADKNINSCNEEDSFQVDKISQNNFDNKSKDLDTDNSLEYYSQDSNDIFIPVPNFKSIREQNIPEKDKINLPVFKYNFIGHSKPDCDSANSTISDLHLKELSLENIDHHQDDFSLNSTNDNDNFPSSQQMIDKLLEHKIKISVANVGPMKLSPLSNVDGSLSHLMSTYQIHNSILNVAEIIDYTWRLVKEFSNYAYLCGSSITNNTSSAIARILIKFIQTETIRNENHNYVTKRGRSH